MQRGLIIAFLVVVGCAAAFWATGGFDRLASYAAVQQRGFQNDIALGLRSLRAGNAGAFWGLMALCFGYGFFHAVGPGHGKVVMGGYGIGADVAARRLAVIGLLSSLGQAVTAVVLVYGGIWIFSMTREALVGTADRMMAPVSYGAIVLVGLWLLVRGARKLRRPKKHDHAHDHEHHHDHSHDEDGHCNECGHRHGPTVEEVAKATGLRDALLLIASIAIRPCTGALFVLIITWQMGIAASGIAGAFAMAFGTAVVTIGVGLGAVGMRGSLLRGLAGSSALTLAVPLVEIIAGGLVILLAGGLLMRAI
jgi:ABC-type nickel/cobalt efflux system permease component RcnA